MTAPPLAPATPHQTPASTVKPGRLIVVEDEEYASLAPSSSSSARLVKVDGETGQVELMPARAPPPTRRHVSYEPAPYQAGPNDPSSSAPEQRSSHVHRHAVPSVAAPIVLLIPAFVVLLVIVLLLLPIVRRKKLERPPPRINITDTSPRRYAIEFLLVPLIITRDGLVWCLGFLTGSNRKPEEEVRAQAGQMREMLDKALYVDNALEARLALDRLMRLKEDQAMASWLGAAVGPLREEMLEVEEREEHRHQLVRELAEAIERCEETLARIQRQLDTGEDEEEGLSQSCPYSSSSSSSSHSSSSSVMVFHRRAASASSVSASFSSAAAALWAGADDKELRLVAALERVKETLAAGAAAAPAGVTAGAAQATAAATVAKESGNRTTMATISTTTAAAHTCPTLVSLVQRGERLRKVWQRGKDGPAEEELARHHSHAMNPPPMPAVVAAAAAAVGNHTYSNISTSTHFQDSDFVVVEEVEEEKERGEKNGLLFSSLAGTSALKGLVIGEETNASVDCVGTGGIEPRGSKGEGEEVGEIESTGSGLGGKLERRSRDNNIISRSSSNSMAVNGVMMVANCSDLSRTMSTTGGEMTTYHQQDEQHHQRQAALLGAFAHGMQQELRRQTTATRVIQLEDLLEKRRQDRARHKKEEGRAAKAEQSRRREMLRQRGQELVEARRRHEVECGAADERRRQRDQALFTYMLPVSLAVFVLVVYVASVSEDSEKRGGSGGMLLADALWHVPFHDLLYGDCKVRASSSSSSSSSSSPSSSAPAIKVVHHSVKRIPGAARPAPSSSPITGSLRFLSWLGDQLMPDGVDLGLKSAFEMTGCYVKRTLALVISTGVAVLLHYLMGGLGLGQHRAKLHVGLLLYCCRDAFARMTWRSLLSVRSILGFHALLWTVTAWKDAGHAFKHRHRLFHRIVPLCAVGVGVWDAARHVDPVVAWESFQNIMENLITHISM